MTNKWYEGASRYMTGQFAATTVPRVLGVNVPCRRLLLIAKAGDVVYVVSQGQPAAAGFPIPQIQVDGNHRYLELWVNNVQVVWLVGASGQETVYWLAEEV